MPAALDHEDVGKATTPCQREKPYRRLATLLAAMVCISSQSQRAHACCSAAAWLAATRATAGPGAGAGARAAKEV